MQVPMLDLDAQLETIRADVKSEVEEVIDSTRYIMGPKVTALEEQVAKYTDAKHGIGVSSGTDALLVALMALDIGPGDLVITTPYSFFATAGVIARLKATPVFVDIDEKTFNMDPGKLQEWFEANPDDIQKVKALIPVHLFGQCADMDLILDLAGRYNIPVIEDAAQAIGSTYPSKDGLQKAGSIGTMGCFSFFPSKNLGGIGDGGMVTTNDDALAEKLRKLRNHGAHPKYYHSMVGGNFRLDPIQAAVLSVKLPHLDSWHKARQKNAAYYDEHLKDYGITIPHLAYQRENHIYNQYVILVPEKRDELQQYLKENNIGNAIYYPVPFHLQECFANLGYQQGDLPVSEYAADHSLAIPVYPELTEEMQNYVINTIGEFYGK